MDVILILFGALLLSWPLGYYLTGIYAGKPHASDIIFLPLERLIYRVIGVDATQSMDWRGYARAFLLSNLVLGLVAFLLLWGQQWLPLNPDGAGAMSWDLALHTAVSFLTNTNQQHYSGQLQLSFFSQSVVLVALQFVTPAMGLAIALAVLRGLQGGQQGVKSCNAEHDHEQPRLVGNFYQDTVRALVRLLVPLSLLLSLLLTSQGVPSSYQAAVQVPLLEQGATAPSTEAPSTEASSSAATETAAPATQRIPLGPVAAMVAIKQLGTNGGGWYGPNSSNPLENPTSISNAAQIIAIVIIPMAMVWMMGGLWQQRRFALLTFGVMALLSVSLTALAIYSEQQPNPAFAGLASVGGNMEGKEVRFGPELSALWASVTTQTSNGSVNAMHDSLNPLAGLTTRAAMLINAIWGGIGCGLVNYLVYVWCAVFFAGLMIGKTPEMFGRKLEKTELGLIGALLVLPSAVILTFTAITVSIPGLAGTSNPGLHGLSQVFYEYTSAFANNGSGFEGLADNTVWWNVSTVITLLLGRYLPLLLPLWVAGRLAAKRATPDSNASLPLHSLTFGCTLVLVILLLNFLSFLPSMVLGPIGEALQP